MVEVDGGLTGMTTVEGVRGVRDIHVTVRWNTQRKKACFSQRRHMPQEGPMLHSLVPAITRIYLRVLQS